MAIHFVEWIIGIGYYRVEFLEIYFGDLENI